MSTLGERIKRSWNVFIGREPTPVYNEFSYGSSFRPDRPKLTRGNEKSIINSIYNKIAVDVSAIDIRHVRLDENDRYIETLDTTLNECLTLNANVDQTGRAFIQDAVMSMFDEGCVALVITDATNSPVTSGSYKILAMRTGKIVEWYPKRVKVNVYNDETGKREDVILPKEIVAIIENPFYSVMNEPNSTLQRLIRILNNIDRTNEKNSAGKMDLIIQLPYLVKSQTKREQAEERRKAIERQLTGSQYGIAYIDGTEHITQLNRSVENNLWEQAKDLTSQLYSQLGVTKNVFDGTADEKMLLDYYNRTIEPILCSITEEMRRKFLTPTARAQKQSIEYFREPFKLVPVNDMAELANSFIRNEILTPNEFRGIIGFKPSNEAKADQLHNANMPDGNVDNNENNEETENKDTMTKTLNSKLEVNQNESKRGL